MKYHKQLLPFIARIKAEEPFVDDECFAYNPNGGFKIYESNGYVHKVIIESTFKDLVFSWIVFRSVSNGSYIYCMPTPDGFIKEENIIFVPSELYEACASYDLHHNMSYIRTALKDKEKKYYIIGLEKLKKHARRGNTSIAKLLERIWVSNEFIDSNLVRHNDNWNIRLDCQWQSVIINDVYGIDNNTWVLFENVDKCYFALVRLVNGHFFHSGNIICNYEEMLNYINLFAGTRMRSLIDRLEDDIELNW